MKKENLYCPFCKGSLMVTHQDRYEDLAEHVCDPNGTPSMKDGYDCLNEECLAYGTHTWVESGEYYMSRPKDIEYQIWEDRRKHYAGGENYFAIGSWQYHYTRGKDAIKAKTKSINLHWYKLNLYPQEKGWNYEIEERHMPHPWKWKLEIWKRASEYGYTHVIPFWRMTAFSIRQFRQSYSTWKETGNARSLKAAYCDAHSLDEWNMKLDPRFYSRLASWIIRLVYLNQVKALNKAMQSTK
jgi:hypothetical protein